MFDIFHTLRARSMINNKKAQKLIQWNQDNTYKNELMYFGQSKANLARTGILREYSLGKKVTKENFTKFVGLNLVFYLISSFFMCLYHLDHFIEKMTILP